MPVKSTEVKYINRINELLQLEINEYIKLFITLGNTLSSHKSKLDYLTELIRFDKFKSLNDIKSISSKDILNYLANCEIKSENKTLSPATKNKKLSVLKAFFKYIIEIENININNPVNLISKFKLEKKEIDYLNSDEIEEFKHNLNNPTYKNSHHESYSSHLLKRDKAMIYLMFNIGLRVSEITNLNIEDVNIVENSILIKDRKYNKSQKLFFNDITKQILSEYIKERNSQKDTTLYNFPLFLNSRGDRIQCDGINGVIKKYAPVGRKNITTHTIRRTMATTMLKKTDNIAIVSKILGHENIQTTMNYYAGIAQEEIGVALVNFEF